MVLPGDDVVDLPGTSPPPVPDGGDEPGLPADDVIDRLRARLCDRFLREVDEAGERFPDPGACIGWVVLRCRLFDRDWSERFFPARPPEAAAPPRVTAPGGRVRGRTLREWWEHLTPRVLAWGWQQPWARYGDGVEGLLGEAYVRAVELWRHSDRCFALNRDATTGEVTESTDCAFAWVSAILCGLAARRRTGSPGVSLAFDPADRRACRSTDVGTVTSPPDRQLLARRVRCLSGLLPVPVPNLEERIGGRGTLQLLLVADQLETASGLPDHYRRQWCLQTLAGKSPERVAEEMGTTRGNIETRFCRIRTRAQSTLGDLWCRYVPSAPPTPEGNTRE